MMRLARPMVQSGESWRAVGENSFAPTDRRPRRRSAIERIHSQGVRGARGRSGVRINADLRLAALGRLQGRLEVERAVVEGAAGDGSADAFAFVAGQLLDVLETVDPAARDHRDLQLPRELDRRLDVDPGEHAVAADVGINERLDTVVLEFLGKI